MRRVKFFIYGLRRYKLWRWINYKTGAQVWIKEYPEPTFTDHMFIRGPIGGKFEGFIRGHGYREEFVK